MVKPIYDDLGGAWPMPPPFDPPLAFAFGHNNGRTDRHYDHRLAQYVDVSPS